MPVTQYQQHSASSADHADTTMKESVVAEPNETLEENSLDAITHFWCNIRGEQQENGRLLAAFESLQIQSMLDFILLEQNEDLECATTIYDGKLTCIEIRKLLKAKEWFITQPDTKDMSTWSHLTSELFSNSLIYCHPNRNATNN